MRYRNIVLPLLLIALLNGCGEMTERTPHEISQTQEPIYDTNTTNTPHDTNLSESRHDTTDTEEPPKEDRGEADPVVQTQQDRLLYATYHPDQDIAMLYGEATQGSQSDYQYYQPASYAIDGKATTYNHTSGNDKENWLQIALPSGTKIHKVVVTSRQGFSKRLEGAKVYLSNTPYSGNLDGEMVQRLQATTQPQTLLFDPPKVYQYLLIKAEAGHPLHLSSVNLYGTLVENPSIQPHSQRYLIAYTTPKGKEITTIQAKDLQHDTLHYTLNVGVPFRIDDQGHLFVSGRLQPDSVYHLTVGVSDGKSRSTTQFEVVTTAVDALTHALQTGDTSGVTKAILMEAFDKAIIQHYADNPTYMMIKEGIDNFYNGKVGVTFSECSTTYKHLKSLPNDGTCISDNDFVTALPLIHERLVAIEKKKLPFKAIEDEPLQLLVLLGDKYRQEVSFDGDPQERGEQPFLRSIFADYTVYSYRHYNPVQPDMGNYSRSHFPQVTRIDKTIHRKSRPPFRSTGLYAFPGETFSVTRTDTHKETAVTVFVGTLRPDATHIFNKYRRPRYTHGVRYPIAPGETLKITSCYGGPIELGFVRGVSQEVVLSFSHVGEHPYWQSAADDAKFQAALDANSFDWAELSTPGFEVHAKREKMQESIANWAKRNENSPKTDRYSVPTASNLANATIHFTSNYPFGLAGYHGKSIDPIEEVDRFAQNNGLSIREIDFVKHMNSDQAACGYGCSGNPYDAFWAFAPTGHGDIHEIGHSLQAGKFLLTIDDIKWGVHAATNPYAYYTKSKYYMETGAEPSCQGMLFGKAYKALNQAVASADRHRYMYEHYWKESGYAEQFMVALQSMMSIQQMGKEGTIAGEARIRFGWHLLTRVHVLLREFERVRTNEADWEHTKDALGFSSYTREEAKQLSNNDIMIILYSKAGYADFRAYWDMWGLPYSAKAASQIASFGYPSVPQRFFFSTADGYCKVDSYSQTDAVNPLDKLFAPVDGNITWGGN